MVERIAVQVQRAGGSTRRALFGRAAGIVALVSLDEIEASKRGKRRTRKKRCRKRGQTCSSSGGKRRCCHGRTCDIAGPDGLGPTRCCQPNLGPCKEDHDCCGLSICGGDGPEPRCLLVLQP